MLVVEVSETATIAVKHVDISDVAVRAGRDPVEEQRKEVIEPAIDLLKRMIIHIPDEGFRTIRYYGFYHPKKEKILERIYELSGERKEGIQR